MTFGHKNITETYKDEQYLLNGYYSLSNGSIVYLDNNFVVREIETNKEIEKITSVEEYLSKYMNNK